jgi:membrane protein YdbS with pleckstrin-like domain
VDEPRADASPEAPTVLDRPADVPADPLLWPPGLEWRHVSPKLLIVRRIAVLLWLIPIAVATLLVVLFTEQRWLWYGIPVVGVLAVAWWLRLVSRAVRSWGYAEREDDLLIRRGVLVRRLTIVPYGRMQFVDVRIGPIERLLGIATVQLHTAAAATDAYIPGLPTEEAARLRDVLTALGEARAAGL